MSNRSKSFAGLPFFILGFLLSYSLTVLQAAESPSHENPRYVRVTESVIKRAEDAVSEGPKNQIQMRLTAGRSIAGLPPGVEQALALKNVNRSLELTVQGGNLFLKGEDPKQSEELLRQAFREYEDNPLAILLLGDFYARKGSRGEAIHYYLVFLERMKAKDRNALASLLFKQREKNIATRHVTERLRSYGFEPPKTNGIDFLSLFPNPGRGPLSVQKIAVAYVLPFLIFFGIPFFIYRRMMTDDTSPVMDRILYELYFVLIVSYGFWLARLMFNFASFGPSQEAEALGLLIVGIIAVFATEWFRKVWEHECERRDPETVFCPHCNRSILKLAIVCPFCNRRTNVRRRKGAPRLRRAGVK